MKFENGLSFAQQLDTADPLRSFRKKFIIPERNGKQQVYFLGNSLGLQPRSANDHIQIILKDWASLGVESFFHAKEPWMDYHDKLVHPLSKIVGALPNEVVVMNQLTVNLHLMLVSFYNPDPKRYKIICEAKAFPSDQYAFETHVRNKACLPDRQGFDPPTAIIEVAPRNGEYTLRTEDIISTIEKHGSETALVLFGGINYYTGQFFDLEKISKTARSIGAKVGFDLAHAAGNVELHLHDWDVDFACWCTYKYLNSGPGAIGGAFIHEKHHNENLPRFAGWWGYDKPTRFKMEKGFKAMPGAEGWQLSTPAMFLYAAHRASLEIFEEAGWSKILAKQKLLTNYLWFLLDEINNSSSKKIIEFITPRNENDRGCQVSMLMLENGKEIYNELMKQEIFTDWREPNVIRLAPVPLYNSFEEVFKFSDALRQLIGKFHSA
ncbi:MAG TPA: kynureninase [Chitinophagaceae bacterium]|jgi:kynureninase|nr:kynureninase [Chitinophagaceae bacterium]